MYIFLSIYISRTTVRVGGLEVSSSRIGFVRTMVISSAIVLVLVLTNGESLNLRKKTSKSVIYEPCLKLPGTTTYKKRFPKLDYKSSYNDS